ncbi:bacteriohemerythrin [Pelotalea chapellei]|uniref:Hemerythrin family protein n=1 Tax=Pelotalea chapellei TaxID=44671 RepID=A0ABS5UCV3_9BACT|nr:bacteriohemerythrin [Pelotalea chapellei]MBT1073515.1 hemerythrin family protein [Pelotalea chapellei]
MGIKWRESLSIGVETIDNQHKELLQRFDDLLCACKEGKGTDELKGLLDFLSGYVRTHFNDEEAIQRLHQYPEYEEHKREHESFVVRLKALQGEIGSERVAVHHVMETNSMLLKWLTNHISVVDKKLGQFLLAAKA